MTTTSPSTFRKKPVTIQAIQWDGTNVEAVQAFAGAYFNDIDPADRAEDPARTAEVYDILHSTWVGVYDGQWIVRGVKGEFYPIAPDVLAETYDAVSDD